MQFGKISLIPGDCPQQGFTINFNFLTFAFHNEESALQFSVNSIKPAKGEEFSPFCISASTNRMILYHQLHQ